VGEEGREEGRGRRVKREVRQLDDRCFASNKEYFFLNFGNNWMFLTRKNHFLIAIISNTFN
jgi:hypothetical protein